MKSRKESTDGHKDLYLKASDKAGVSLIGFLSLGNSISLSKQTIKFLETVN